MHCRRHSVPRRAPRSGCTARCAACQSAALGSFQTATYPPRIRPRRLSADRGPSRVARCRCRNRAQRGGTPREGALGRALQRSHVLPDASGLSARAIQASFGASRRAAVAGLRFTIQRRPRWSSMNRWQVWDHRMASRCRLLGRRRRCRLCCCRCCCTSAQLQGCELLRLYGAELLAQAMPQGPSALKGRQAGGAALALALHCERGGGRSSADTSCCCQRQQPLWSSPIRCLLTAPSPCPFCLTQPAHLDHLHPVPAAVPSLRLSLCVLVLHAGLMVREGFRALDAAGRPLRSASPPAAWNTADLVWGFLYTRPGALRQFRLQCALQAATRRMFVHACEVDDAGEPLQDNIQVGGRGLNMFIAARWRICQVDVSPACALGSAALAWAHAAWLASWLLDAPARRSWACCWKTTCPRGTRCTGGPAAAGRA